MAADAHTDHDESHVCLRRASGHVLDEVPLSACNGEGVVSLVHLDSFGVQAMVTPCLSALLDLDFLFHRCRWVHHSFEGLLFLDAFGSGDFPSLSSGPEHAISSSAFLSSDVPDSELQVSVFHTLNVETDG